MLPTPLSVRMLEQLVDFVATKDWADFKLMPFFSMVDRRKSLHQEVIEDVRHRFRSILPTEIPYSSEIERMTQRRAPLNSYAHASEQAQAYESLWSDVKRRMRR
jgi:cellulose biosynthesis protein BcsQ